MRKRTQAPTIRQRKAGSWLQERLASALAEKEFAGLEGMITIKAVEVTADLREAKVWFSSLGQNPNEVLKILNREIYNIQRVLFRGAHMRVVPRIKFYIDNSAELIQHLGQVFTRLHGE